MASSQHFIAWNRFGYGPDPSGLNTLGEDPIQFLRNQLENPRPPSLLASKTGIKKAENYLNHIKEFGAGSDEVGKRRLKLEYGRFVRDLSEARIKSDQPLIERLIAFWSNHFTVSVTNKTYLLGLLRDYQYTAIRSHVTGNFVDMLIAVAQHPAMLSYLDNINSFGPNSRAGKLTGRGLNENLAREILELHTMSVDGGYSQNDVLEFAKIITGWSLTTRQKQQIMEFDFHNFRHEPGPKKFLGRTIQEGGINEGLTALRMLAEHPATARHLATKMAIHFVSDDPPESLIRKLEDAYLQSGGNLKAMTLALIEAEESWEEPLAKVKSTPEFVLSAYRATGYKPSQREILSAFKALDYRPFRAGSPKGFPDQSENWATPTTIMKRMEWAMELSGRLSITTNPYNQAKELLGSTMEDATKFVIRGAESGSQGIALMLMSPEFQKR
ncbi:DUF1800 domain-containing protein [Parendozoicomonas haliclonae]|uniref:DUF1800 domain-containing protein n=1 Tax=Parendozoicomonas haliclonae TaxID=1960125 RepID=A0A1X7AFY8_9GAMM|nr:DUF1800 domain-containing protein [Parendozoicomonas haliclonae]SMA38838.1 hypothetical protein EHSB41UT_00932 [Parendozoicomonas haliclonae]